jgi:TatD DNase family protein
MFDTHCHIHSQEFDENREELLQELQKNSIQAILVGTSIEDSKKAIELALQYPFLYAAIGVHPHEYDRIDINAIQEEMDILLKINSIIEIGETGFDFYYHKPEEVREQQEALFRLHIEFALEYNKPLIIHTRDSFEETFQVLSEYKGLIIILHCFTGNSDWVYKFNTLSHSIYFSFSGIITFNNAVSIQEAVKIVPENQLLAETDAPYLTPIPYRGQQNTPLFVLYTINKIAELRQIDIQKLTEILDYNTKKAFSIDI